LSDIGTVMNDGTALDKIEQLKKFTNKEWIF
jgi:hypothetical protein